MPAHTSSIYDVLIAGGGPAGATAAYLLAVRGLRVLVLDSAVFPRPKLCAGLLTAKTIGVVGRTFQIGLQDLKDLGLIVRTDYDYAICNRDGLLVSGRLDFPFHRVDRRRYDAFWLNRALRAGARVHQGEGLAQLDPTGNRVVSTLGNRYRGRIVIGADGVHSRVRRTLINAGRLRVDWTKGLAMALEVFVPRRRGGGLPEWPSLYYGFVPWGYAWSFPGPEYQAVGMCALQNKAGPRLRRCFREFLNAQGLPAALSDSARGFPLPYGNYLPRPACGRILLLGDAAGLADPLLGEGLFYAHHSAVLAARSIAATGVEPAAHYCRSLAGAVLSELRWAKVYRNLIYGVLRLNRYRPLGFCFRRAPKKIEAIIQGQRRFGRGIIG